MQAVRRLSNRYFTFYHLQFPCCSILNSNITRKYWKIAHFRNQQLSLSFCTFPKNQSQQNDEAVEKQATEPNLVSIGSIPAAGEEEQAENMMTVREETLDFKLSNDRKRALLIRMQSSKNGNKWIQLLIKDKSTAVNYRLAKIAVPKDAYLVVSAMDALMSKSVDDKKPPICHELIKDGLFYDYKLGIGRQKNQLYFTIETIENEAKPWHKPKLIFIPIQMIPSLRNGIAKMLAEFDGTDEEIRPLPYLPKWITENDEKTIGLKKLKYAVDVEPQNRIVMITLEQGVSGTKFITILLQSLYDQIKFKNNRIYFNFPHIIVPEDAYPLLNAMCALSNDLEGKHVNGIRQNDSSLICHQMVKGLFFDYQLEIHVRRNQQLDFRMRTITTNALPTHTPKNLYGPIPIDVFNWLKNQMAEILLLNFLEEKHQQNQQIEPLPPLPNPKSTNEETNQQVARNANKSQQELKLIRSKMMEYTVYAEPRDRRIRIQLNRRESGGKFIKIDQADKKLSYRKIKWSSPYSFSSISVPEDAYPLLKAMFALSNDLELYLTRIQQNYKTLICRQIVKGIFFNYKLEIHLCKNKELDFRMETITTDVEPFHISRKLYGPIPIDVFYWLKDQLTKMLLIDNSQ